MRINASGIVNNSNIDLTNYNISAKFLLGNGSYITDIVATTATTSNSTTWWSGITSWASGWFTEVSNQLRFNKTKLNETINAFLGNVTFTGKIIWSQAFNGTLARNSTIASYIVAKNNTLGTYVRAKNDSLAIWVLAKGYSTGGGSMNYTNLARINISNTFGAFNQTFDTNVFFIDATRNRIGIGTTNPQNLLNVLGDANVTGNLFINNLKAITWTNAFNGTLARNSTIATYILAKDGLYNNTIKSYLDAKDLSFNTSLKNYLDTKDTNFNNTLKSYLDAKDTSFNNSIASWAGIKFVNASGDTLTGTFNFNGGWQTSGLTISGGDIYAQTGFFYNITGLDVNTLNVNGTILPPTRWNNTFDIGNATLRWNDLYLGGVLYSSGAIYTGGSQVATNSTIASYIVAKNNTLGTYVRAKNDSLASFISGKGYINWVNAINGTLANTKASNTFDAFNQTFDTNVFFIDSTRNRIGIGDTNPSKTLNVKGTFNLTSNATFDTNTFFVDATRNRIGILETNPSKTLTVKGDVNVTGIADFGHISYNVDSWVNMSDVPAASGLGSDLAYTGGDYIYVLRGGSDTFYRYSISNNSWTTLAATTGAISYGGSLAYTSGNYIYALQGSATGSTGFFRYSILNNSWATMTSTPAGISQGASLVYTGGDYIYTPRGNVVNPDFFRFSISTSSWTNMTDTPATTSSGASLVYTGGDYLYLTQGGGTSKIFYRYSISANSWTTLATIPGSISYGSSLTYRGGDYIYVLRGSSTGSTDFFRYSISANYWSNMTDIQYAISSGGDMVLNICHILQ